jgi:uncharacterized membrane-anchored protein
MIIIIIIAIIIVIIIIIIIIITDSFINTIINTFNSFSNIIIFLHLVRI